MNWAVWLQSVPMFAQGVMVPGWKEWWGLCRFIRHLARLETPLTDSNDGFTQEWPCELEKDKCCFGEGKPGVWRQKSRYYTEKCWDFVIFPV